MCESPLIRVLVVLISFYWITNCDGTVSVLNGKHFAPEGDKTTINCNVTDETFIGWFRDSSGQKITSNPSQRVHVRADGNMKYLEISKVNKSDQGTYECRGITNKTRVMLLVEYGPVLNRDKSSTKTIFSSLDSNEDVTLTCTFDGYPVPKVKFQMAGVELNNSGVTSRLGFASYKFRVRSLNDFGFYACVATNSRGQEKHYIEVYERGAPEPPNNMQVSPTCDRIDVTWDASRKDGGSPVTGYTIKLQQGGDIVKSESLSTSSRTTSFRNLKKETQYEVRMNAKNALGEGEWRRISVNTTETCTGKHVSSANTFSVVTLLIMCAHLVLCLL